MKVLRLSRAVGAFHGAIPRQLDSALAAAGRKPPVHCDAREALRGRSRCLPTTGFMSVHLMLSLCGRVSLFGLSNSSVTRHCGMAKRATARAFTPRPADTRALATQGPPDARALPLL